MQVKIHLNKFNNKKMLLNKIYNNKKQNKIKMNLILLNLFMMKMLLIIIKKMKIFNNFRQWKLLQNI